MRKYVSFGLLLISASILADTGSTNRYVWNNSPTPCSPFNAWTNAAHDIQTAVSYASAGDTVWVTNGIYTNSLNGSNNSSQLIIKYKALTLRSVNGADVTIIDGNYPYVTNRCIEVQIPGVTIDGFTITNGYMTIQYACAGIVIGVIDGAGYGIIKNCVISGNRSINAGNNGSGAGIQMLGSNGLIDNCVISGNSNSFLGGGVYFYNSGNTMQFCRVVGNISGTGGGVYARKSTVLKNCVFSNNVALQTGYVDGGGIYLTGGTIENCLICYNIASTNAGSISAARGGGVSAGGMFKVLNCTIVKNVAGQGGGLFYYDAPGPTGSVVNTIIDLNTLYSGSAGPGVAIAWGHNNFDVSFTNCSLQCRADVAGHSTTNNQCLFEINNGFVDTNTGNFRLLSSSPCVNAGTNQDWMTNAVDIDGNRRIIDGNVDMGAYEFLPLRRTGQ